jgi:hypothetical protein
MSANKHSLSTPATRGGNLSGSTQRNAEMSKSIGKSVVAAAADEWVSAREAQVLAAMAEVICDPLDNSSRCDSHHPNAAGALVHTASAPMTLAGNYNYSVDNATVSTNAIGSIVLATNNGANRLLVTAPSDTSVPNVSRFAAAMTTEIPGGGSYTGGVYVPGPVTCFHGGVLYDASGATNFCMLPALSSNASGPPVAYMVYLDGYSSGTPTSIVVQITPAALPTLVFYRCWYQSGGLWTQSAWTAVGGAGVSYTNAPNVFAVAVELSCTVEVSVNAVVTIIAGGLTTNAIAMTNCELFLQPIAVPWWYNIDFRNFITLAAGEVITCTGTDLTAGGDIAVGVPGYGTYPGNLPSGANYYQAISGLVRNKYIGNLKFGGSAFHVPKIEDRLVYKGCIYLNDWRIYAIRSTTVPTFQIKMDSSFDVTTNSPALHPLPVPMVPHFEALYAALSALERCGDNRDHLKWLKSQAKRLKNWVTSPEGRKVLAEGVDVAKKVGTLAASLAPLLL